MSRRLYFLAALLPVVTAIQAAPNDTRAQQTLLVDSQSGETAIRAQRWGLSAEEWNDYQDIMQDRRGIWSPGLDPVTALGVSAKSVTERNRYAELYVRTEFERTRQELAFQLAVDRAWARLYPHTPRLQARAMPNVSESPTVRYAFIVSTECLECEAALAGRLSGMLEQAQEGVDVYVVGTDDDDQQLRAWIAHQPEVLRALKAKRATINHGETFKDLAAIPAIYAKAASGQWSRAF